MRASSASRKAASPRRAFPVVASWFSARASDGRAPGGRFEAPVERGERVGRLREVALEAGQSARELPGAGEQVAGARVALQRVELEVEPGLGSWPGSRSSDTRASWSGRVEASTPRISSTVRSRSSSRGGSLPRSVTLSAQEQWSFWPPGGSTRRRARREAGCRRAGQFERPRATRGSTRPSRSRSSSSSRPRIHHS